MMQSTSSPADLPVSSRRRPLAAAGVLLALTAVAYIPVYRATLVSEDAIHITGNKDLRSAAGLVRIWTEREATKQYYPLTTTTFWIEYQLWGERAPGYHIVNVTLHALNALLFWLVLRRLGVPGAWWAAAVFALHPVHVQSVAWVTERKNVLSTLFYLLAALSWFRAKPLDKDPETVPLRRWYYALALLAYVAALLSKTVTVTLPAALLLVTWWKRRRLAWSDVQLLIPLFVVGLLMGLGTLGLESELVTQGQGQWQQLTPAERVLVAGRALVFYVSKLCWPSELSFLYRRWAVDGAVWWQYLYPAIVVVVLGALWFGRRRIGWGGLVAALFFIGTLLPTLGILDFSYMLYSFVANHFAYLPSLGLIALAGAVGAGVGRRLGPGVVRVVAAVLLVALGGLTWQRGVVHHDAVSLGRDIVAKDPDSWAGNVGLSDTLIKQDRAVEAIPYLKAALRLRPEHPTLAGSLANAYMENGQVEEAAEAYRTALRNSPDDPFTHYNLALTCDQVGEHDEALRHCAEAARLDPAFTEATQTLRKMLSSRLQALLQAGEGDAAVALLQEMTQLVPDWADLHGTLGRLLVMSGRNEEALAPCATAVRLQPRNAQAHSLYAAALNHVGRFDDAIREYRASLAINGNQPDALSGLAWILATTPNAELRAGEEAVRLAEQACALTRHQHPMTLDALAAALAEAGRFEEAVEAAEHARARAVELGNEALAGEIAQRARLYAERRPYRENGTSPASQPASGPATSSPTGTP